MTYHVGASQYTKNEFFNILRICCRVNYKIALSFSEQTIKIKVI